MSDDKTRDPIDVAREVWALEWREFNFGVISAQCADSDVFISTELLGPSWMGEPTVVVQGNGRARVHHATDLRAALTEARRLTLKRLEAAAALCREPYPVPVVRHPTTGEAVLMLTEDGGDPLPIVAAWLEMPDATLNPDTEGGTYLTLMKGGGWAWVRESEPDIRQTLRMLAEEPTP